MACFFDLGDSWCALFDVPDSHKEQANCIKQHVSLVQDQGTISLGCVLLLGFIESLSRKT